MRLDIFTEKRLFPTYSHPIKQHYTDYFDTVFIAFSPFFKLKGGSYSQGGFQRANQIPFEDLQKVNEMFKNMPKPAASIYAYNNNDYPNDEEIIENAVPVSWQEIKAGSGFQDFKDINKALKTSIGSYRNVFQRLDLAKQLTDFTRANQIYHPTEGHFEVLIKREMFKAFRLLGKTALIIEEEFCQNRKELEIANLSETAFVQAIHFKDYFIYDKSKELLFAVDWDDFFFLICSDKTTVDKIISTLNFEGFYCDANTQIPWEITREEIEAGLEKEKQITELNSTSNALQRKPWWKFW